MNRHETDLFLVILHEYNFHFGNNKPTQSILTNKVSIVLNCHSQFDGSVQMFLSDGVYWGYIDLVFYHVIRTDETGGGGYTDPSFILFFF